MILFVISYVYYKEMYQAIFYKPDTLRLVKP